MRVFEHAGQGNSWENTPEIGKYRIDSITYDANGNILTLARNGTKKTPDEAMDRLAYDYTPGTNRLDHVDDAVGAALYDKDIDAQQAGNYAYNAIGQMTADAGEEIALIEWTLSGKVKKISRTAGSEQPGLEFEYDAMGYRVKKTVKGTNGTPDKVTRYVRDAQGNVISVYEEDADGLWRTEQYLYGSARLGTYRERVQLTKNTEHPDSNRYQRMLGRKHYELTNHLGNVLSTVTDQKKAVNDGNGNIDHWEVLLVSYSDYYPGGFPQPGRQLNSGSYRYGHNTQESDPEISGSWGTHYTAQFWMYDSRIIRRWNLDPKPIIGISDYVCFGNNPIYYTDPLGDFRTKFGARVYKFFHGGTITKAQYGDRAGEYYVSNRVDGGAGRKGRGRLANGTIELDEVNITEQIKWNWGGSTAAEYVRGGAGAAWNFGKFIFGGGGNTTYGEGSFEADMLATSPGVRKNIERYRNQLESGKTVPFSYSFSPNPKAVLNDIFNLENPFGSSISDENVEAHVDVFKTQSFTKLYVGGYVGTMRLMNANTVKITITNATSANSFLLHGGEIIFGRENGAQRFNDLWNKTPFLNTQSQRFEFSVPLNNK